MSIEPGIYIIYTTVSKEAMCRGPNDIMNNLTGRVSDIILDTEKTSQLLY